MWQFFWLLSAHFASISSRIRAGPWRHPKTNKISLNIPWFTFMEFENGDATLACTGSLYTQITVLYPSDAICIATEFTDHTESWIAAKKWMTIFCEECIVEFIGTRSGLHSKAPFCRSCGLCHVVLQRGLPTKLWSCLFSNKTRKLISQDLSSSVSVQNISFTDCRANIKAHI